jgi:hypothetical protein
MRPELPNQPAGWNGVRNALAETRTGLGELQTYITGMFDRLDGLADERLGSRSAQQCALDHAEQEKLKEQIDRLASLAAELAQSVAEQKQLAKGEDGRRRI